VYVDEIRAVLLVSVLGFAKVVFFFCVFLDFVHRNFFSSWWVVCFGFGVVGLLIFLSLVVESIWCVFVFCYLI
jgi:hypothetical protein